MTRGYFSFQKQIKDSATKSQSARISQGCLLFYLLFVVVMNVIITDALAVLRDSVNDIRSECYM